MTTRKKPTTLEEMPLEELRDAMANYETASLKITRRNDRGQLSTVYNNISMSLEEMLGIDEWLRANAGGGRFRVETRNPADKSMYIVPPFHVGVEGVPRPPRFLGNPQHTNPMLQPQRQEAPVNPYDPQGGYPQVPYGYPQQQQQQQQQVDPYAPPPSPWANGLHPSQQGGYISQRSYRIGGAPAPGATMASDQIALRQLQEQKAEKAAQIAKLEAQNAALLERLDRMADEAKKEREESREERHRMELRALEARMEALAKPKEETKPNGTADLIAALAPFAPVFATFVSSNKEAASKSLEVQQQGLQSLMQATLSQSNKPDSTMEMFKSIIMPMMLAQQEQKGPKAQAELFNSMVENNLNSVAMMAQLIEAFAGSGADEPWYLPMVRETMSGVVGMTEAYMQGQGGLPGQRAPMVMGQPPVNRPLPEPRPGVVQQGVPAAPGASAYSTIDIEPAVDVEVIPTTQVPVAEPAHGAMGGGVEAQPSAAEMEAALKRDATPMQRVMLTQLPPDFQTPEWRIIVLALHQTDEVEEVANMISGHVSHLINFGMLPPALADVEQDPARALDRVLGVLPVAKERPDFARAVLTAVIAALVEDGFIAGPDGMVIDTDTETPEAPIEEPVVEEPQVASA